MKKTTGNLLDMFDAGEFDIIVHGCNCYCDMGGGIAAQIAARYPKARDQDMHETACGDESKVGTIDFVWMSGWASKWFPRIFPRRFIVNAYTQARPGRDGREEAVFLAFAELQRQMGRTFLKSARIGIPAIGCGIAGLIWEDVEDLIDRAAPDLNITLVEYQP